MVGSNCRVQLTREFYPPDDATGGAQPSGTILIEEWDARVEQVAAPWLLLAQGIETVTSWACIMRLPPSGVFEGDFLMVVWPPAHYILNETLRVVSVTRDSIAHLSRGHVEVALQRIVRARGRQ